VRLDAAAFEALFEHAGGLLAILDAEGRFLVVNPACVRVLGTEPAALVGRSLLDFARSEAPPPTLDATTLGDDMGGPRQQAFDLLARHRHADGTWRWLMWSGAIHADRWYASARDVTDWIKLEDRVGRDPLTRLPNRELFAGEVSQALARQERSGRKLAVLFVDIDSLKQINDNIGHDAGDRLVAEVAERLRFAIRAGDVVARLGGDEFGILAESLGDELEAVTVAGRALAALDEPFELGSGSLSVSASIGVAIGHGPQDTANSLIHEADIAMYQAKAAGRSRFAIFDSELRAEVERRRGLERDLRSALEHDEIDLRYQPIVALTDGAVIGCEAVLHWDQAQRGVVSASELLPLAEQTGLIVPLGLRERRVAADQAAIWHAQGKSWFVAVNVSRRQLADDNFVASVRAVLAVTALPHGTLTVEVAEAAVLADPERAAERLAELRALGVRITLDDFGSGNAPLRHLVELPLDSIKLDPLFVAELASSRPNRAALIAVVAAARELGIDVMADRVETTQQLDELTALGCSAAQGKVFSAPRAAGDLTLERYAALPLRRAVGS
jgi:diguanylate cyclase (GGDEF)-like protein/PAS domain S-box-containing protein